MSLTHDLQETCRQSWEHRLIMFVIPQPFYIWIYIIKSEKPILTIYVFPFKKIVCDCQAFLVSEQNLASTRPP